MLLFAYGNEVVCKRILLYIFNYFCMHGLLHICLKESEKFKEEISNAMTNAVKEIVKDNKPVDTVLAAM